MEREATISEKLDRVIQSMENKESKKKFNLPLGIRMQQGKIRKNWAVVQILRTNGAVEFKMAPIVDSTIKIGEIYYEATAKHILRYKKYPMIILPEWNITPISNEQTKIEPFDPEQNYKEAIDLGKLSSAEKFILNAIKMDAVKPKMNFNMTTILIVVAVIGGGLLLLNQLGVI